jgi:7-cyano-7-deazaguanine synthase
VKSNDDREKAVALVSGGLDSTVALAMACEKYRVEALLFFDYSQRAAAEERQSVEALARHYHLELMRIELPWLERVSGSALMRGGDEPPDVQGASLDDPSHARAVWVENRNGVFISIAAAVAASNGCDIVITGFNAEEAGSFPDNSQGFVESVNAYLALGTSRRVEVVSPTIRMTKRDIVHEGIRLGIPWRMIWSCYRDGGVMCGRCESCMRLKRAVAGTEACGQVRFEEEKE